MHPQPYDDGWEGWQGLVQRIEDRYWEAEIDFALALGEITV